MGGYGSGNHGGKALVESHLFLDVNQMNRTNTLIGWSGHLTWRNAHGEKVGGVSVKGGVDQIVAFGTLNGEAWKQTFDISWTPCHFGGSRPWFLCPYCSVRVGKLYIGAHGLACRRCYRLTYLSTREDAGGRYWLRREKLEAKLDEDGYKPKGMHWRTYAAIHGQLADLDREWIDQLLMG